MRTLIVSDLHLGTHTRADVLRRALARDALVGALAGVDRLVLLGDVLELRSGPSPQALAAAAPALAALGRALDGRPVVVVPGNHDHALISAWLEQSAAPLDREQRVQPSVASPLAAALSRLLGSGLELAYPGIWVRDDVYATHGHYLDCHVTVPMFERIAVGAMGRFVGGELTDAEDYEARLAPLYAWLHAVAQRAPVGLVNDAGSARAWRAIAASKDGGLRSAVRRGAAAAAFPLAIAGLNRAGLGPLRANLSSAELARSRLLAIGAVVERLASDARHVVFGHTHRTGPLPGDAAEDWRAGATRLVNCGNWVLETHMMAGATQASPYWPGGCVTVDDHDAAPPRLARLLGGATAAELGR